jgi:type II secretory pathway predicted ATPase ExeA
MNPKLQTLYGLKFHPFRPDIPIEALHTTPTIDGFLRRVEYAIADGGFAMITGDPGSGKSIALRLLAHRLRQIPDLTVGTIEHPQSRTSDFYRELGELFGVPLAAHNRFAGFQSLRTRWAEHITATMRRPVLIIDEAQEALTQVFNELRVLASKDLDSRQLLCDVLRRMRCSGGCGPPSSCRWVAGSADVTMSTRLPETSCALAWTTCSRSPATPR